MCSQAAPQHNLEGGEMEMSFEPKLLISTVTGTQRENRAACETAPKQPPFTAGVLSKPEAVSFKKQ